MEELKKFRLLLFFSTIIGITGLYLAYFTDIRLLFHDLTARYTAVIDLKETITLQEEYLFDLKKSAKYRMLYRYWKAPVSYRETLTLPHLNVSEVNSQIPYYIKDHTGKIYGNFPDSLKIFIRQKAYTNEIGIINPGYFSAGNYRLKINYEVFPPIETDREFNHMNIKLADKHIPYTQLSILIKDPFNSIIKIFPHIPNYTIKKVKEGWLIKGKSKKDGLVEIEILTAKYRFNGFYKNINDVYGKTVKANNQINFFSILTTVLTGIVIIFPAFVYFLYEKYGREKVFTVPQFLSFIPDGRKKPYVVNLIFNKDVFETDENAFYSTLLDLHLRKIIEIQPFPSDLQIKILKYYSEDPYEKKVLQFLKKHTVDPEGNIFSSTVLDSKIERYTSSKDITVLKIIKNDIDSLFRYKNRSLSSEFVEDREKKIFQTAVYPVALLCIIFAAIYIIADLEALFPDTDMYPAFILSLTFPLQTLPFLFSYTQLLGRWKGDYYLEKLQWEAFKRFLSDLAMIKKYAPQDISIWEKWLVYATALGVAKKVEKALKSLNIKIEDINISRKTRVYFHRSYRNISRSITKLQASKGGSGGGFGAGGGFAGGGAGGR